MKILHNIWNYVRNSWEGPDGKFSYRRATQFVFVQLMVFMIVNDRVTTEYQFYTFLTVAALFAFVAHLITPKQAIEGMKAAAELKQHTYEDNISMDTSSMGDSSEQLRSIPEQDNQGTETLK